MLKTLVSPHRSGRAPPYLDARKSSGASCEARNRQPFPPRPRNSPHDFRYWTRRYERTASVNGPVQKSYQYKAHEADDRRLD